MGRVLVGVGRQSILDVDQEVVLVVWALAYLHGGGTPYAHIGTPLLVLEVVALEWEVLVQEETLQDRGELLALENIDLLINLFVC